MTTIIESGVYRDLMEAGARMLEPICGPCVGIGQAPLQGAPSLRTFNRNFPGRSGTAEDQVYLCSPSTAAASALAGRIADPSGRDPVYPRPSSAPDITVHDRHITSPLPLDDRISIVVERGPNLVSPQLPPPVPDDMSMRVLIVVGDDVSTGDMAPDGAIAMSVWSNVALCARFMFNRFDTGFHDRSVEWGGGIIVAGDNYGQGSSREHAALIPVYLGVRAIVAKSYARIHRRNLIAAGVVPLVLANAVEAGVGQIWQLNGLRTALRNGASTLVSHIGDTEIELKLELTEGERSVLLSGGLLAHIRRGGRTELPPANIDMTIRTEGTVK